MNNNSTEIKYIIINYHSPNLMSMSAEISFLCSFLDSNNNVFYMWSNKIEDITKALTFDNRDYADAYIKNMGFENTISYGYVYDISHSPKKEWTENDLVNLKNYLLM